MTAWNTDHGELFKEGEGQESGLGKEHPLFLAPKKRNVVLLGKNEELREARLFLVVKANLDA